MIGDSHVKVKSEEKNLGKSLTFIGGLKTCSYLKYKSYKNNILIICRFVNMIAKASAKLDKNKIWTHVREVRKEYYRKSPALWPDECYGFLILTGS